MPSPLLVGFHFILSFIYFFFNFSFYLKGEEVINPKRNIPISIFITLVVCGVLFVGMASVLTLMIPYFMSDSGI